METTATKETAQPEQALPTYLTVKQFVEKHSWATPGGLRHLIFYAKSNGFDRCIRRCGRKVLLNEAEVFAWIEQQRN